MRVGVATKVLSMKPWLEQVVGSEIGAEARKNRSERKTDRKSLTLLCRLLFLLPGKTTTAVEPKTTTTSTTITEKEAEKTTSGAETSRQKTSSKETKITIGTIEARRTTRLIHQMKTSRPVGNLGGEGGEEGRGGGGGGGGGEERDEPEIPVRSSANAIFCLEEWLFVAGIVLFGP